MYFMTNGLDGVYPYTTVSSNLSPAYAIFTRDTPISWLATNTTKLARTDWFTMYLMFRYTNAPSIPVLIKRPSEEAVLKINLREGSSEAAELNADHGDEAPGLRAGGGIFVVAHQPAMMHEPAERALHDPATGPHFEPRGVVGALHDLDRQFRAEFFDPVGEAGTCVSPIHPQNAPPSKPGEPAAQDHLRAGAFGNAGRRHRHAQHQAQRVHQQMPFPAFDALGRIITNLAAVVRRLHALAVQDGGGGSAAFVLRAPDEGAERVMERGPLVIERPFPEAMIDLFPRGKVGGQATPGEAAFDHIEDGVQDAPEIGAGAATFGGFGEHGFEIGPLGVGEAGVIAGVFHAPTEAALKIEPA